MNNYAHSSENPPTFVGGSIFVRALVYLDELINL